MLVTPATQNEPVLVYLIGPVSSSRLDFWHKLPTNWLVGCLNHQQYYTSLLLFLSKMRRASSLTSGFHDFCWVALHFTDSRLRPFGVSWLDVRPATRENGGKIRVTGRRCGGNPKNWGLDFLARFEKKENGPVFWGGGGWNGHFFD